MRITDGKKVQERQVLLSGLRDRNSQINALLSVLVYEVSPASVSAIEGLLDELKTELAACKQRLLEQ
jgi:hypothetical protein